MSEKLRFERVVEQYLNRRGFLKSAGVIGASSFLPGCVDSQDQDGYSKVESPESLPFTELPHGLDSDIAVPEGYDAQVLLRWGDPLFDGVDEFDPNTLSAEEQKRRFGFNNDFIGFTPLPFGSQQSDRGLLVVNHEFTQSKMMFKGAPSQSSLSQAQVDVEIAAHGLSIVEVQKTEQGWRPVLSSKFNRRITPLTPMEIAGPAKGSQRLKSAISQDGVHTLGTYGNCAGGVTPWGTILTGEENIDAFFSGDPNTTPEAENYSRFGMYKGRKNWADYYDRWDVNTSPSEPLHMGWIVEIDPYDSTSIPRKRTALGRFKHEGCNVYINSDQHVVAYTGDDQIDEYVYKFVSKHTYKEHDRASNMRLLDEGVLYAARFDPEGVLTWLPLVYGHGPLTSENGFSGQGDVCLDARKAADLLGATPMDRPEDIEVNPVNGRVFAMLTKNAGKKPWNLNGPNPRAFNTAGQIVEFWPEDGDHTHTEFKWDLFLLAGKPNKTVTKYHPSTSKNGWLACPDNCAFDGYGNIWIATDGAELFGVADGIWVCEVEGKHKALTKRFLRTPKGAEMCGPFFTPNFENLFVSVQHPAGGSSFDRPDNRWPDFDDTLPPRPSVVVVTKKGGGRIGS